MLNKLYFLSRELHFPEMELDEDAKEEKTKYDAIMAEMMGRTGKQLKEVLKHCFSKVLANFKKARHA